MNGQAEPADLRDLVDEFQRHKCRLEARNKDLEKALLRQGEPQKTNSRLAGQIGQLEMQVNKLNDQLKFGR